MVQDLPDNTINKPMFVGECAAHFFESFKKSQSKNDIDNCILAIRLMLQLTPSDMDNLVPNVDRVENAASDVYLQLTFLLSRLGDMLILRFGKIGEIRDVIEAISLQRKGVQLTLEGDHS